MDKLLISINNNKAHILLHNQEASHTIKKIKSILPQRIDLHYAKFAGQEVFGILPIIIPLENKKNVNNLEKGSVVYWPERQFLCIYYGEIQEEDANVTVIGKLLANEEFINEMEKVRYKQGIPMVIKNDDKDNHDQIKQYSHLDGINIDWYFLPVEIKKLASRNGVMQPGGPVFYAEGETRKLADILWVFYQFYQKEGYIPLDILQNILLQSMNRIGGWCGLRTSEENLNKYRLMLLEKNKNISPILEDLILYTNRLNMWIDLLIPWEICNETLKNYKYVLD